MQLETNKKKKMPKWLIAVIVVVIVIIVASSGSGESNGPKSTTDIDKSKQEKFTYTIDSAGPDEYNIGYYIEGTVKNNKNKEYSYVQIEFICYDRDGNNLGTAIDNTNNLLGNETWKFKAMAIDNVEDIDHCDFKEISSW